MDLCFAGASLTDFRRFSSELAGRGSSSRKRVFSHGFIVLCVFVTVFELIALSHYYGTLG